MDVTNDSDREVIYQTSKEAGPLPPAPRLKIAELAKTSKSNCQGGECAGLLAVDEKHERLQHQSGFRYRVRFLKKVGTSYEEIASEGDLDWDAKVRLVGNAGKYRIVIA